MRFVEPFLWIYLNCVCVCVSIREDAYNGLV